MTYLYSILRPGLVAAAIALLPACGVTRPSDEPPPVAPAQESGLDSEASGAPRLQMVTLAGGLDEPWGMAFLPDGNLLITEQGGTLKRVDGTTYAVTEISGVPATVQAGQGGLMDVLVHPDFADNGWVYLSYTVTDDSNRYSTRVSRARLDGDALVDVQDLFTAQPFFRERRHFGSRLLLADGYLYVTVGDRGNRELAQRLDSHNGKVMRLFEDGRVPEDNPFVGTDGALPEIWTYGHRNPQGMARHPVNGSIWVTEHGPQGGDELNVLKAGANYGWPLVTYGEEYGGGAIGEGTHLEGTRQPLVYWVPSIGTGNLAFYTGDVYPGWQPSALVSGLKLTRISRLQLDADGVGNETRLLANLGMRIRDVEIGPDGKLYALAGGARLIRIDLGR
ncbi:PQQ-dependent sugar dehydrogenase [Parahaliea mediterranea]|uniref:PQQ-dependent sugar dehydrogenase n=1 Tax=Parahaliea mediterranea TaxID=651086 RepID=UPI000E2E6FFD|nr:PQQ-dependent sugar dehydrogenase [Parahaliea mediterranea]